jgi:hypothetical protein
MSDDLAYRVPARIQRIGRLALTVGAIGVAIAATGAFVNPRQFFFSWLVGYMLCLGISLGCLALLMMQYLTGGLWGIVIRRIVEAGARTLPLVVLFFVPLLFGLRELFPWARPEVMAADVVLQRKALYLNVPFFLARAAIYFACWLAFAWFLSAWAERVEATGDQTAQIRLRRLGAGGILVYGFTITFASIDWLMSLEPHWFSSIFGMLMMVGQGLGAISFSIVIVALLSREKALSLLLTRKVMLDLGNLMLAFTMLWAYMSFSQFLIIWSGNLPEEIPFYIDRLNHGWQWMALGLVVFHFAVPFVALLMRATKQVPRNLAILAGLVLFMRLVDLFWIVAPEGRRGQFGVHWMDLAAPIGMAGLWVAFFAWQFALRPMLPVRETTHVLAEMGLRVGQ